MANWYGDARTNYFAVKDPEAFKAAMAPFDVKVVAGDESGFNPQPGKFALLAETEFGDFPTCTSDGEEDLDFEDLVAEHLADDEVAVFETVGAEKMRYLTGYALAINNKKERREINLSAIFELAKELGPNVTNAAW